MRITASTSIPSPHAVKPVAVTVRDLKSLRQEYDRDIAGALASDDCGWKLRIANVIDRLCELDEHLPIKVRENRKLLAKHIARRNRLGGI